MDGARLTKTRIRAGVWEGVLSGTDKPALEVRHLEAVVPGVTVTAIPDRPGEWAVRVPVPVEVLAEGVQTFLMRDRETQSALDPRRRGSRTPAGGGVDAAGTGWDHR